MLFELAARHCRIHGCHFYACHVNHGIRGEEALRDRDFCLRLAKECPECREIFVLNVHVPSLAEESGESIEQCARRVRYSFFDKIMGERSIPILATAHNSDDRLETLIFNLTRGSGVRGMCGIPSSRQLENGILIRPMLNISKSEVLEFCRESALDFVTDSTNADTEYTRNMIRARVLPVLEDINPSVRRAAARLTDAMSELCSMTLESARGYVSDDASVPLSGLKNADPRLLPYIFSIAAEMNGADLEAVHLDALKTLCAEARELSSLSLPNGFIALIENECLCFTKDLPKLPSAELDIPLSEGTFPFDCGSLSVHVSENELEISISLFPDGEKSVNNQNVYKLDINTHIIFDTIRWSVGGIRLRTRAPGDRILIRSMHKSVKKLMCDARLPRQQRDALPLLAFDNEILWIPTVAVADGVIIKKEERYEQ